MFNLTKKSTSIKSIIKISSDEQSTKELDESSEESSVEDLNYRLKKESIEHLKHRSRRELVENSRKQDTIDEIKISKSILKGVNKEIDELNEKQKRILDLLMNNKTDNLLIRLEPYSGEKVAYLINALEDIDINVNDTQVIIVQPTAELIYQTTELAKRIGKHTEIKIKSITRDNKPQTKVNEHLIICTIGCLLFCLNRDNKFNLDKIKCVVFDEFELIISSRKFVDYILQIVRRLKLKTQLQFISTSSFDRYALNFAKKFKKKELKVLNLISNKDDYFKNLFQFVIHFSKCSEKYRYLLNVIKNRKESKLLIYGVGKAATFELNKALREDKFKSDLLTSDLSLEKRIGIIKSFKKSKNAILVVLFPCDVSIELNELKLIINYNLPVKNEEFCHEYYYKVSKCARLTCPAFILNFVDNYSSSCKSEIERCFHFKMIKLDAN